MRGCGRTRWAAAVAVGALLQLGCGGSGTDVVGGAPETALPPPAVDIGAPADGRLQTAVLAGGCFWSVEAVFEAVKGVVDVVSGYVGGSAETARYDLVAWAGTTQHAEAVEITFDPNVVSYGQLLRVFFSAAHDPTQLDRQTPDVGPQYRSHIYYMTDAQRDVAAAYIEQIDGSGALAKPVVTRLDPLDVFYWAEEEHQDFVLKNPENDYVRFYSIPKLLRLGALLPDLYRRPWGVWY